MSLSNKLTLDKVAVEGKRVVMRWEYIGYSTQAIGNGIISCQLPNWHSGGVLVRKCALHVLLTPFVLMWVHKSEGYWYVSQFRPLGRGQEVNFLVVTFSIHGTCPWGDSAWMQVMWWEAARYIQVLHRHFNNPTYNVANQRRDCIIYPREVISPPCIGLIWPQKLQINGNKGKVLNLLGPKWCLQLRGRGGRKQTTLQTSHFNNLLSKGFLCCLLERFEMQDWESLMIKVQLKLTPAMEMSKGHVALLSLVNQWQAAWSKVHRPPVHKAQC